MTTRSRAAAAAAAVARRGGGGKGGKNYDGKAETQGRNTSISQLRVAERSGRRNCAPPQQDITDLGYPDSALGPAHTLRAGWYDVKGRGCANDFCRYAVQPPGSALDKRWVCALAGERNEYAWIAHNETQGCTGQTPDWGCLFYSPGKTPYAVKTNGGPSMDNANAYLVFLGKRWESPSFAQDIIPGLEFFFKNLGATRHFRTTMREYIPDARLVLRDTLVVSRSAVRGGGGDSRASKPVSFASVSSEAQLDSRLLDELCFSVISPKHVKQAIYAVYLDIPRPEFMASYCAFHSLLRCPWSKEWFKYAVFFDTRNDAECSVDNPPQFRRSQALANLANMALHEMAETMTDPNCETGYTNYSGEEVADLCEWMTGLVDLGPPSSSSLTFRNRPWVLQALWSNKAFRKQTGMANHDGERGCVLLR